MADITKTGVQPILDFLSGKRPEVPRVAKIERCGLTYTDKVTLITGAAKGMGQGIAEVFVDAGAKVMICDIDVEPGVKLAQDLTGKGPGQCVFEKCDVSVPEEVRAVIDKTLKHYGRLDCLINNAGYHGPYRRLDDCPEEDLLKMWQTNFLSQFVGCRHALPHLRKTKGSIINMSSCTAVLGQEGGAMYSSTKGAISAFTKSLAVDEIAHGVRVNAVCPGNIYSESRRAGMASMGPKGPEVDRWCDANQPIGRSGTTQEVGQVCLFLASDAASFLAGLELMITAGIELSVGVKYPAIWI